MRIMLEREFFISLTGGQDSAFSSIFFDSSLFQALASGIEQKQHKFTFGADCHTLIKGSIGHSKLGP